MLQWFPYKSHDRLITTWTYIFKSKETQQKQCPLLCFISSFDENRSHTRVHALASLNFSRDCSGLKTNWSGTSSQWQRGRPLDLNTWSATLCSVARLMTREWRRAETISSSSSQRIWQRERTQTKEKLITALWTEAGRRRGVVTCLYHTESTTSNILY